MSISRTTLNEPFHERHSDVFGQVRLYAPEGDPAVWNESPWVLTTERDGKDPKPIRVRLKPEHVMKVFHSPGLIYKWMLWPDEDDL